MPFTEPLPVLHASYDVDWNGDGYFTLDTPQTCPDCDSTVRLARARPHLSGDWTATCPHCLTTLGRIEPVPPTETTHRCATCGVELFEPDRLCTKCEDATYEGQD